MDPRKKPWERQPNETSKQFAAFTKYRDCDPQTRSVERLANESGASAGTWERWSSPWSWVDRALAWDDEQDRVWREKRLAAVEEMAARHAQAAQVYIQSLLQPAVALLKRIRAEPEFMDRLISSDPWLALTHIERLARAFQIVVNVERLSRGEPVNIQQIAAQMHETTGARESATAILEDPETAAAANELLARINRRSS